MAIASQRTPAPCTYCVKTKKHCTFEWLKSQESHLRVKKDVHSDMTTKANKRFKNNSYSQSSSNNTQASESDSSTSPDCFDQNHYMDGSTTSLDTEPAQDYPFVDPTLQQYPYDQCSFGSHGEMSLPGYQYEQMNYPTSSYPYDFPNGNVLVPQVMSPQAGIIWNQPNASDISFLSPNSKRPLLTFDEYTSDEPDHDGGTFAIPIGLLDPSPISLADRLSRSVNHNIVSEGLMKIYHDSMENALSCWLAERTCPYLNKTKMIAQAPAAATTEKYTRVSSDEDWTNRMFNRVYRLDRVAGRIRTRPLSHNEERAASKALYLVIMAFATQWSQGSQRSREEFPSPSEHSSTMESHSLSTSPNSTTADNYDDFDRRLQETYWHEARNALLLCAETESFKVAFANIIFAFIQKPLSTETRASIRHAAATSCVFSASTFDINLIEDEVERVLAEDAPPMYFEQGIRNAHLLRDRLLRLEQELDGTGEKLLGAENRTTVDLVAWLGYMGDTITSTSLHRPLVVSDDECDVLPEAIEALRLSDSELPQQRPGASRLWSDYMFLQERFNRTHEAIRFPCTYDEAAAGLTDAAPIKVLLYRKVQAIQNLITRHAVSSKIEQAIQDAKGVYHHWKVVYEPFVHDLIEHHDSLHPRLQAWYICLTSHYYLAALLLAESMKQVDTASLGLKSHQLHRDAGNVIHSLRRHNSLMIASVAARATPHDNSTFPTSDFHHAMSSGALLTEPWTALLIRAFFKATIVLLQDASSLSGQGSIRLQLTRGAEECVRAIKYLGRKSDTAVLAGEMLTIAINRTIKNNNVPPMSDLAPGHEYSVLDDKTLEIFHELCNDTNGPQLDILV